MITRRNAIRNALAASATLAIPAIPNWAAQAAEPAAASSTPAPTGPYKLPDLPYPYDAFEPHIDAETMRIHHDKHHAAYVAKLNVAVADYPDIGQKPVEELIKDLDAVPVKIRKAVRNQGGGHYNHSIWWPMLKKGGGGEPTGALAEAIKQNFGSFEEFKKKFSAEAGLVFGSGWTWLVRDDGKLEIESTANQDSPLSEGRFPVLGIDVWEHAYYLKQQNKRADYIAAWWNVIDWDHAGERYKSAS
ncbi:MAG: superoxide dismutase [Terrimicrobiaceae bacterium]|nr:superoxide dismutase [Terrimicrobiaceae bacterium]